MAVHTLPEPGGFHADGTVFAGYQIQSLVERGDTAFVYRAWDLRLNRPVALKVLAPGLADDPALRLLFVRESQLGASLDHANVLPIYDAGEAEGTVYIATRYVEGPTLQEILAAEGRLAPGRLLVLLDQIADALDAAHRHGLLHRDIKPRDVFVAPSADGAEHVYLSNFGVTDMVARRTRGASSTELRRYATPEQRSGLPDTARTDVYALGCLAHECLTGAAPSHRPDEAIAAPVRKVLARATADDADARYPTCSAFVAELAQAIAVGAGPPRRSAITRFRRPVSTAGLRAAARRRARTLVVLGALLGVVALAATTVAFRANATHRLDATEALPLSMSYPSTWKRIGAGDRLMLSPRAEALQAIFSGPQDASDWASARKVMREPTDVVGVALWALPTEAGIPAAKAGEKALQSELTGVLSPVRPRSEVPGDPVAARVDAVLADPQNPSVRLVVQCYVIPLRTTPRTAYVVVFSAEQQIRWRQTELDDVARSVVRAE